MDDKNIQLTLGQARQAGLVAESAELPPGARGVRSGRPSSLSRHKAVFYAKDGIGGHAKHQICRHASTMDHEECRSGLLRLQPGHSVCAHPMTEPALLMLPTLSSQFPSPGQPSKTNGTGCQAAAMAARAVDWENPSVIGINKRAAHAPLRSFANPKQALDHYRLRAGGFPSGCLNIGCRCHRNNSWHFRNGSLLPEHRLPPPYLTCRRKRHTVASRPPSPWRCRRPC